MLSSSQLVVQKCATDDDAVTTRRRSFVETLFNQSNFPFFGSSDNVDTFKRHIHLMDDRCLTAAFNHKTLGSELLAEVFRHLNIYGPAHFFGIRYTDNNNLPQWLEMDQRVYKQIKDLKNVALEFRVTFYPPNPLEVLPSPTAKHMFYMQLRRDFYAGRLRTNSEFRYKLAAHAIQADHGLIAIPEGFDVVNIPGGMRILPSMPHEAIDRICSYLTPLLGMHTEEAKEEFIQHACTVETYGMEPFQVMDQFDNGLCIGFNHMGISAFKNGERTDVFPWSQIRELRKSGKHLIIVIPRKQSEVQLGFKAHSWAEAKMLYKRAMSVRNFARQTNMKKEVSSIASSSQTHSEDEPVNVTNYEVRSYMGLEPDSEVSNSSGDDFQHFSVNNKRLIEASQSSLRRFIPVARHSLAVPLPGISALPRVQTRSNISSSMDLPTPSADTCPQVIEFRGLPSGRNITRSSINLNNENSITTRRDTT